MSSSKVLTGAGTPMVTSLSVKPATTGDYVAVFVGENMIPLTPDGCDELAELLLNAAITLRHRMGKSEVPSWKIQGYNDGHGDFSVDIEFAKPTQRILLDPETAWNFGNEILLVVAGEIAGEVGSEKAVEIIEEFESKVGGTPE